MIAASQEQSSSDFGCIEKSIHYVWTNKGIHCLRSNGILIKYGTPQVGNRVPEWIQNERVWDFMVMQQWVLHASLSHAIDPLQSLPECRQASGPSPIVARSSFQRPDALTHSNSTEETDASVLEAITLDTAYDLGSVIRDWMKKHPGCLVEVIQQEDVPAAGSLVRALLHELTPFDLDPWGPQGVNETLAVMRDEKVPCAVSAQALREKGVNFLSPQVWALEAAASSANNKRLAGFILQARSDPNIHRMFAKFFFPGSLINSSEWHQDQASEEQLTWSRCLIYLTSRSEGMAQPLHYIEFRATIAPMMRVKIGFPRALAMSGPLRCGTVQIGNHSIRFEHKGEAPRGTACCFALDAVNLSSVLEDFREFFQTQPAEPPDIVIPGNLCMSSHYRVIDDKIEFMDSASHAAWLKDTGMTEYWEHGGQALKKQFNRDYSSDGRFAEEITIG
jgi:hypothetical protein